MEMEMEMQMEIEIEIEIEIERDRERAGGNHRSMYVRKCIFSSRRRRGNLLNLNTGGQDQLSPRWRRVRSKGQASHSQEMAWLHDCSALGPWPTGVQTRNQQ